MSITWNLETIVLVILLIDSIGANLVAWTSGRRWYRENLRSFSRLFPATRGWATYYLILVLWMGVIIYRAGYIAF
jgi:hypothetical protein